MPHIWNRKIDLGIDLDPVSVSSYGSIAYNVNKEKTIIRVTSKIDILRFISPSFLH